MRAPRATTAWATACALALLLPMSASTLAEAGATAEEIDALIESGAGDLGLHVIERDQPSLSSNAARWQRLERRRLDILAARENWTALTERVGDYPQTVPDDFWTYAHEKLARAHLANGDARAAISLITDLVWGPAQDTAMVDERRARLRRWRELLAESYLLDGRFDDAQTTMLRYRLDYGDVPADWRLLEAKAFVRADDGARARELLQGMQSTEAEYLRMLIRTRAAGADPVDLLVEAGPMLGERRLARAERSQLWAALAAAAAAYRDHVIRVTSTEQALALATPLAARDRFERIDGDDLWDAYDAYAAALANEAQLLVGRFGDWLELARSYDGSGDIRARALYAYLAAQNRDAEVAGAAQSHLVDALAGESRGLAILGALYLDSDRYPRIADIPEQVRAPLVAYALNSSHADVASRLVDGLDSGTRAALPLRWRAAVAVALIDNGRVGEALELFPEHGDAEGSDEMGNWMADALARLALALQRAGEYERSAKLATRGVAHAHDQQRRRALLMLGADSETLAGRHERAARLYLDASRIPIEPPGENRARVAGLEAAAALARAGLEADAVAVLERLSADGTAASADDFLGRMLRGF